MTDDKSKKLEEETYKLKNEILNIKASFDNLNKNVNSTKDELTTNINKLSSDLNQNLIDLDKTLKEEISDQIKNFNNYVDKKFSDVNNLMSISDGKESLPNMLSVEGDDKKTNEDPKIIKRIHDLEKTFRIFNSTINTDNINKEMLKINNLLNEKCSKTEFLEFKELFKRFVKSAA